MTDSSALERLIGTWAFEPTVDGKSVGRGRATFEWIEDGAFVLERSQANWADAGWIDNAPASNRAVIGLDDTTGELVQLYADSRGVTRIYRMTLTGRRDLGARLPHHLPQAALRRSP
jgi:hypothetical protein